MEDLLEGQDAPVSQGEKEKQTAQENQEHVGNPREEEERREFLELCEGWMG